MSDPTIKCQECKAHVLRDAPLENMPEEAEQRRYNLFDPWASGYILAYYQMKNFYEKKISELKRDMARRLIKGGEG